MLQEAASAAVVCEAVLTRFHGKLNTLVQISPKRCPLPIPQQLVSSVLACPATQIFFCKEGKAYGAGPGAVPEEGEQWAMGHMLEVKLGINVSSKLDL